MMMIGLINQLIKTFLINKLSYLLIMSELEILEMSELEMSDNFKQLLNILKNDSYYFIDRVFKLEIQNVVNNFMVNLNDTDKHVLTIFTLYIIDIISVKYHFEPEKLEFLNTHIPYLEYIIFEIKQFFEIFKTNLERRYSTNMPYYNLHFIKPLETLEILKTHVEGVHESKRRAIGLVSLKTQQGKNTYKNTQIQKIKEAQFRTRHEELIKERGEEEKALLDSKLELLITTTNKECAVNIKIESQILENDYNKLFKLNTPIWLHRDFKEHYKTNIETSHAALDRLFKIQKKMWATTFRTVYPTNETFLETPTLNDKIERITKHTQRISDKIDEKIASIKSLHDQSFQ